MSLTEIKTLSVLDLLLKELEQEAQTTRKMLAIVPGDKFDWQPHPKSMTIRSLTTHISELPGWIAMTLNTDELDFATSPYQPVAIENTKDLLAYFERSLAGGKAALETATEAQLLENWTLRNGDEVYTTSTKVEFIRITYSQIIHHRAQLGVFLRLLNIPIPGSYGPSADEMSF